MGTPTIAPPTPPKTVGKTVRKTPTKLRLWTAAVIVLAAATLTTATIAVADTQGGINKVGRDAAPQAQATSDLYFALSDLDSQTARTILAIGDDDLATPELDAELTINRRVADIDTGLRVAVHGTSDPQVQAEFQTMLDKVALYHDLAATALSLDSTAIDPATGQPVTTKGHPAPAALAYYSRATDVMHFDLLPTAAKLRDAYNKQLHKAASDEKSSWNLDLVLVLVTGLALLGALLIFQVQLARRFARSLNPFLAIATAVTAGVLVTGLAMTSQETDRLQTAVDNHMTPYLNIQYARAVAYDASGATIRYVVAPNFGYDRGLKADAAQLNGQNGPSLLAVGLAGSDRQLTARIGKDWASVQADAGKIEDEVGSGDVDAALIEATGITSGQLGMDFYALDFHLGQAADTQRDAFNAAMARARSGASGWAAVPAVAFGSVIALALAGVRRRLAEYS